ncbi:hypothetical protein Acor_75650 [Acrocarpospora corrugata]|uniref:Uncharacterized protein n=1 Tax=Acrocarpospora corrugata TaxID=35763 RepID=A0A5M3W8U6_9ACTN|nr:hypothetical protein Acor_75650 [Acrocarpospora corrugata]
MDENVLTTVYRDEAVALVRVKPFDGALRHFPTPLAGLATDHTHSTAWSVTFRAEEITFSPATSIVLDHTCSKPWDNRVNPHFDCAPTPFQEGRILDL